MSREKLMVEYPQPSGHGFLSSYKTDDREAFLEEPNAALTAADNKAIESGIDITKENCYYAISHLGDEWIAVLYVQGSTFLGIVKVPQNDDKKE